MEAERAKTPQVTITGRGDFLLFPFALSSFSHTVGILALDRLQDTFFLPFALNQPALPPLPSLP